MSREGKAPPAYRFRQLLEGSPLSDREIARAAGKSYSTVRRWRAGKARPSWGDVERVTRVVGKRVDGLARTVNDLERACEKYREATYLAAGMDAQGNGAYRE